MKFSPSSLPGVPSPGFSLIETMVVVAVIAVLSSMAIANISDTRAATRQSIVALQEKTLNGAYKSLRAVNAVLPTTKEEILAVLATNSQVRIVPPETMPGADGTLTLSFDSSSDLFVYAEAPTEE